MEEIRSAALAFHANSNEGQQLAKNLFESLDTKGNGLIGFKVYVAMFRSLQEKLGTHIKLWNHVTDPKFFGHLDRDGDGFLDKQDVITLSYLMQNGKLLFCDTCGEFLNASYFSCVACFNRSTDGSFYTLCSRCYRRRIFVHNKAHVEFLDNHSLLMKKRHEAAANSTNKSANATSTSKLDPTKILSHIMVACVTKLAIGSGVGIAAEFFRSDHVTSTVGTSDVASASNAVYAGSDHVASVSDTASVAADPSTFSDIVSSTLEILFNFL